MPFTVTLTRRRRNNFVRNYCFQRAQVKIQFSQGSLRKDVFWATHVNRKWCLFPYNRTWSYQICIVKCLYSHRGNLLENLGKTTLHSNPKFSFELTCIAQKRLYLSSLLGWFSNRTGTSFDDGKARKRTKLYFRCPVCRSAIGQASCLICARRRQLTFPFSLLFSPHRRKNNKCTLALKLCIPKIITLKRVISTIANLFVIFLLLLWIFFIFL